MEVLGRRSGAGPAAALGRYRARDGSAGAPVGLDLGRPHAGLVVGKRGSGKSHTLGVLAEDLARAQGLAPVVADPMGGFETLARPADGEPVPATVTRPRVSAGALDPRGWCGLLGLDPTGAAGALVWQAAAQAGTLEEMRAFVTDAAAAEPTRRAATNHLDLAAAWDVFDGEAVDAETLAGKEVTVLDLAGMGRAPMNAVLAAVARALYDARLAGRIRRLPWLLVDEAHVFFEGVAGPALRRLLTRGRQPGVSLVAATQRPASLPGVAVSQADLLVAHRLTGRADVEALSAARPTFLAGSLADRLPESRGEALVVDDATERAHVVRVRERDTPHGGVAPRAGASKLSSSAPD